jgi:hypothetical protein
MNLTNQEQKLFDYIASHRGCTTREIQHYTWISYPSARITEINKKARRENMPEPIVSIGHKKFAGARQFEIYAIERPSPIHLRKEHLSD